MPVLKFEPPIAAIDKKGNITKPAAKRTIRSDAKMRERETERAVNKLVEAENAEERREAAEKAAHNKMDFEVGEHPAAP
jgi:hypothetical protein